MKWFEFMCDTINTQWHRHKTNTHTGSKSSFKKPKCCKLDGNLLNDPSHSWFAMLFFYSVASTFKCLRCSFQLQLLRRQSTVFRCWLLRFTRNQFIYVVLFYYYYFFFCLFSIRPIYFSATQMQIFVYKFSMQSIRAPQHQRWTILTNKQVTRNVSNEKVKQNWMKEIGDNDSDDTFCSSHTQRKK